jgi:NADH-quinone oxidoreductase subunit L
VSESLLWLIPAAPLIAAVLTALFGRVLGEQSYWPCVAALAASFAASAWLLFGGFAGTPDGAVASGYTWMSVGGLDVSINLRADAMTATMLVTVTFVSMLVAIFSSGYMQGDPGYARYFAEVALFVFSMCMLVLADNFLVLFVFWEGVGLCSYLLIGYWFEKPAAAAAAKKAFVVNRIGDFALLVGLFLIWKSFGTLDFAGVLRNGDALGTLAASDPWLIVTICLLLFAGAAGKSAQFPLHTWLPDAMEGPTPVSALIHAATMVTAGVYLVARCTPLFVLAPEAQISVACIGGFTAVLAALIALTQTDLKRVLAYSTVSQLGYMFLALGAAAVGESAVSAAVTAAMFHLFTHAFFKALLFLGSGSVMHAMGGVIDMRRFGGLRRLMPVTHATFLCGAAALAGAPLLAGFWSKDEILVALARGANGDGRWSVVFLALLIVAILTAVLTAFYTFRAYFLTFWGDERVPEEAGHHAHESPPVMTLPLVVLAAFALFVGLAVGPTGLFAGYIERTPGLPEAEPHHIDWLVMAGGTIAALVGIGIAFAMYFAGRALPERAANPLHGLSFNRFYLDEIYYAAIVWPLKGLGWLGDRFDRHVIDRVVNFFGRIPEAFGSAVRPVQNGLVPSYAVVMLFGFAVFFLSMVMMR